MGRQNKPLIDSQFVCHPLNSRPRTLGARETFWIRREQWPCRPG